MKNSVTLIKLRKAEEPGKDMCVNRRQRSKQKESSVGRDPPQEAFGIHPSAGKRAIGRQKFSS